MLTFITSVRHPQNSHDYARVERLLRRTLASVCRQDDEHRVVVVCNTVPAGEFPPQVEFVKVDFPPPSSDRGPRTGREAVLLDKGTKLAVALIAAQEHGPSHIMKFDADDFVSRRLAGTVRSSGGPGHVVERGYILSASTGLAAPVENFNGVCGTSEIIANELFDLPSDLPSVSASQAEIVDSLDPFLVRDLLGSHRSSVEHFARVGTPLTPLTYPGAVYVVSTGENHSGKSGVAQGRPVTRSMADEFGLHHVRSPRAWAYLVSQQSRSALGRVRRRLVNR